MRFGTGTKKPATGPEFAASLARNPAENWTIGLGSIAGVRLRLHSLSLLGVAVLLLLRQDGGSGGIAFAVIITSMSLLIHEIGHAVTAKRFGAAVQCVILYPLRAITFAESGRLKTREQLRVALAGPAINLAVALVVWAALAILGAPAFSAVALRAVPHSDFPTRIVFINGLLAIVNLLPALPFDGGRALLIVLLCRLSRIKAVSIAVQVSLVVSCAIGGIALWIHMPILSLVGVFIALSATHEAKVMGAHSIDLQHESAGSMIAENVVPLTSGSTVTQAEVLVRGCRQSVFPVFQGDALVGLVSRLALVRGLARRRDFPYVAELMTRNFAVIDGSAGAQEAITMLSQAPLGSVAVFAADEFAGLITAVSVRKFLADRAAEEIEVERKAASASVPARRGGA